MIAQYSGMIAQYSGMISVSRCCSLTVCLHQRNDPDGRAEGRTASTKLTTNTHEVLGLQIRGSLLPYNLISCFCQQWLERCAI
jgi:hypothetical protein